MIVRRKGPLAATLLSFSMAALAMNLGGCSLFDLGLRDDDEVARIGGGRLITPDQYRLEVVVLTRPQHDSTLNATLWAVSDEQVVEPDLRRALQDNGLRVGRVVGDLPPDVEALLKANPPDRPDMLTLVHPVGTTAILETSDAPAQPELTLLRKHPNGKVDGKSYSTAKGYLRVNGRYDDAGGIALRLVPELRHGPVTQSYSPAPSTGIVSPLEFLPKSGQAEESFRDLAIALDLAPGQTAVVGCHPEKAGTLGDLLFQKLDGPSDRILQRVLLIRAYRVGDDVLELPELSPVDPDDPALGLVGPKAR